MGINIPEKLFPYSIIFDHDICHISYSFEFFLCIEFFMFEKLFECQRAFIVFFSSCMDSLITLLRRCFYVDDRRIAQFPYSLDYIHFSRSVEDKDIILRILDKTLYSSQENILSKCRPKESTHFRIVFPSCCYVEFPEKVPRNTRNGECTPTSLLRDIPWDGSLPCTTSSTDDIGLFHRCYLSQTEARNWFISPEYRMRASQRS